MLKPELLEILVCPENHSRLALADDGSIPAAVKLRKKFPAGLIEMTRLPGLGPKRARRLFDELGIDSLEALQTAADDQRIRELKGFGAKAEESILSALQDAGNSRLFAGSGIADVAGHGGHWRQHSTNHPFFVCQKAKEHARYASKRCGSYVHGSGIGSGLGAFLLNLQCAQCPARAR